MTIVTCDKVSALGAFLDIHYDEITEGYNGNDFCVGNDEYLVLTDDEAYEECKEYIQDTLWAFDAKFIAGFAIRGLSNAAIKALAKVQQELCEDANDLVYALIDDIDHFVKKAMVAEGRGHFLARYDSEEIEYSYNGDTFYIYRTN